MKKTYGKPLVSVEMLTLDQPIAATCTADRDDMKDLLGFGYFTSEKNCEMWIGSGDSGKGGKIDWDRDGTWDDAHDTVCYHSNVQTASLS